MPKFIPPNKVGMKRPKPPPPPMEDDEESMMEEAPMEAEETPEFDPVSFCEGLTPEQKTQLKDYLLSEEVSEKETVEG